MYEEIWHCQVGGAGPVCLSRIMWYRMGWHFPLYHIIRKISISLNTILSTQKHRAPSWQSALQFQPVHIVSVVLISGTFVKPYISIKYFPHSPEEVARALKILCWVIFFITTSAMHRINQRQCVLSGECSVYQLCERRCFLSAWKRHLPF